MDIGRAYRGLYSLYSQNFELSCLITLIKWNRDVGLNKNIALGFNEIKIFCFKPWIKSSLSRRRFLTNEINWKIKHDNCSLKQSLVIARSKCAILNSNYCFRSEMPTKYTVLFVQMLLMCELRKKCECESCGIHLYSNQSQIP